MTKETKDEPQYAQDSLYNRKLIGITEKYMALLKFQMKKDLETLKKDAWEIASRSDNPKVKDACRELDRLEIE